jgi:hypothetical protein
MRSVSTLRSIDPTGAAYRRAYTLKKTASDAVFCTGNGQNSGETRQA